MINSPGKPLKRILDPIDRTSEILFGLIMALTFTCSISIVQHGEAEIRTMLLGALGCNIAWGIIDGAFFVMASLAEKTREDNILQSVRKSVDTVYAKKLIAESLPSAVASVLRTEELESVRMRLVELPEPQKTARVDRQDVLSFFAVFVLVVLTTFPVVIPFILFSNVILALRLSNALAMAIMYTAGARLGKARGRSRFGTGITFVGIGAIMVGICMALGG